MWKTRRDELETGPISIGGAICGLIGAEFDFSIIEESLEYRSTKGACQLPWKVMVI